MFRSEAFRISATTADLGSGPLPEPRHFSISDRSFTVGKRTSIFSGEGASTGRIGAGAGVPLSVPICAGTKIKARITTKATSPRITRMSEAKSQPSRPPTKNPGSRRGFLGTYKSSRSYKSYLPLLRLRLFSRGSSATQNLTHLKAGKAANNNILAQLRDLRVEQVLDRLGIVLHERLLE